LRSQTRPLLPSERTAAAGGAGGGSVPPRHCVQCLDRRQLQIGQRLFLFDAVFDTNTGQQQVYTHGHMRCLSFHSFHILWILCCIQYLSYQSVVSADGWCCLLICQRCHFNIVILSCIQVYDESVAGLVAGCFQGYNATVLAFGQTVHICCSQVYQHAFCHKATRFHSAFNVVLS
jgi:hypothetical protein